MAKPAKALFAGFAFLFYVSRFKSKEIKEFSGIIGE
jgi:hypothetical protein